VLKEKHEGDANKNFQWLI